ncbi:hypothetical protein IAR55_004929 [Kwoniella newhampshirensis]|uniref:Uncharacterized protein n=1 Tax=Kwoniella newhampshirensis TaxID=1651941 RepID=A0AAW0YX22_9TREE
MSIVRTRTVHNPRSVQAIVLVVVIIILAYALLSGGRKGKRSRTTYRRDTSPEKGSSLRVEDGSHSARHGGGAERGNRRSSRGREREVEAESGDRGHGEPFRSRDKDGSRSRDGKSRGEREREKDRKNKEGEKKKKREKKKKAEPIAWLQPPVPPPLSPIPDHRTARPVASALRKRDQVTDQLPASPRKDLKYVDEVGRTGSPVTKQMQKWGDFVGLRDDSDKPYQNRPPKPPKQWWEGSKTIKGDRKNWSASALRSKNVLKDSLLEKMEEAEQIGRAQRGDELWEEALRDEWDEDLGPVPAIAKRMALEFGWRFKQEDVHHLAAALAARKKAAKKLDGKRPSITEFINKIALNVPQDKVPYKLALGWFCDTYRCQVPTKRMGITDEPIPTTTDPKTAAISQMLAWMEYFGSLMMAQRIFVGVDLAGLTMRVLASKEGETFRLDLTVFLPGGPQNRYKQPEHDWTMRVQESQSALRAFWKELTGQLYPTPNNMIDGEQFTRRRLIFRPGWTVLGINQETLRDNPGMSIARKVFVRRRPRQLEIPANIRDQIPSTWQNIHLRHALQRLCPAEVTFQPLRQYHWDEHSMTPDSSAFTAMNFMLALQFIGEKLQFGEGKDNIAIHKTSDFIRYLDLGGYNPTFQTDPPVFISLKDYPAIEVLVMTYIPLGERHSTAEIILKKSYGLLDRLDEQRPKTDSRILVPPPPPIKVFVSVADQRGAMKLIRDLDSKLAEEGGPHMSSGNPKLASETIRALASRALTHLYLVDESEADGSREGSSARGVPLRYDPSGAERLLGIDHARSTTPPPASSPTPSPPPPPLPPRPRPATPPPRPPSA